LGNEFYLLRIKICNILLKKGKILDVRCAEKKILGMDIRIIARSACGGSMWMREYRETGQVNAED